MPTRPTQLRIPPDLLQRIDQAASEKNLTRTAWLLGAAEAQLDHRVDSTSTAPEPDIRPRYRCPQGCMGTATVANENLRCVRCNSKVVAV